MDLKMVIWVLMETLNEGDTIKVLRFVIVISKLLKHHSKVKLRAPAYSQVLNQIRGVVQRIVHGRLRSGCQRAREGRPGAKVGVL